LKVSLGEELDGTSRNRHPQRPMCLRGTEAGGSRRYVIHGNGSYRREIPCGVTNAPLQRLPIFHFPFSICHFYHLTAVAICDQR
jgi:hypothetical protein